MLSFSGYPSTALNTSPPPMLLPPVAGLKIYDPVFDSLVRLIVTETRRLSRARAKRQHAVKLH